LPQKTLHFSQLQLTQSCHASINTSEREKSAQILVMALNRALRQTAIPFQMLAESLEGVFGKRSTLVATPVLQPATRLQIVLQTHDAGHPTWLACMEELPCPPKIIAIKITTSSLAQKDKSGCETA
jgi:hypothetical protein